VQPVGDDYNIFYHSSFFIIMFIGFVFSEKREKVIYKGRWRYFTLSERRDKVEISLNICYWGEKKSPRYYLRIYEIGGLNYYYYIFFFCPNLSGCVWWGTVVQVLQSRMPICIPRVSFDDFYLHGSPDFSGHLTFHLLHVKSQMQLCPPSLSLSSLLSFSLSFSVPSPFFLKKNTPRRFRAGV